MKISAFFTACTLLMLSLTPAALAADSQGKKAAAPKVKVKLSPEMEEKEKAFNKIRKKLTTEQDSLVSEMEQKFMQTIDPDIQILTLASDLSACTPPEDEKAKMTEQFKAFQTKRNDQQIILWGQFEKQYMPRVDFMDQKMLKEHLALQLKIATVTAAQLIRLKASQTDKTQLCDEAQKTLAAFNKENSQ
ncbi:MAG: hypothetical protein KDI61_02620 [Alphaproteobacteria bacterium]|nr:hypothetical protein [Alphaproteobacteria bacterium]MCB1839143.1 hypothetical protein [Alphaproteobacteria bacterium]